MALNYVEIETILEELDLKGAILQKATPITYESFTFSFYKPGKPIDVLISMDKFCRIHKQSIKYPKLGKTHNLTEFFKAYLLGGRVLDIKQLDKNRIILIKILKGAEQFSIYIRLWGGFSNIIITDKNNIILHLHKKSSKKLELPGKTFTLPSPRDNQKEYILQDHSYDTYNLYIEKEFEKKIKEDFSNNIESKTNALRIKKEREIKKELEKLNNRLSLYLDSETYKLYADLILSNIFRIKKGDLSLKCMNYEDSKEIIIPLDPKLDPVNNSQKYYTKHKKAINGVEITKNLILKLESELEKINNLEVNIEKLSNKKIEKEKPGLFYKSGEWEIFVGRNSKENEELLRNYVKGNDMWLHTRDYPGGYVFIKNIKNKTIPLDTLIDAGILALFYSKGKGNSTGDIMYTHVKYLRKIKKGKPGQVIPSNDKNLYVTMNKQRLEKLKP